VLNSSLLQKLLHEFEVDTQFWGIREAKTVSDLLSEILEDESYLRIDKDGIIRVVEIVKMFIPNVLYPHRGYLLEWGQYFPDGRYRERKQNPAGKIKRGESPEEALIREAQEELSINKCEFYELSALTTELESGSSRSYPGLSCLYIVHGFNMILGNESEVYSKSEFTKTEKNGTKLIFKWEK